MKLSVSNLNPYAQSYIPLAKRDSDDKNKLECVVSSFVCGSQNHHVAEDSKLKGQEIDVPHDVSYQDPHGMVGQRFTDEEFEMNLAYLRMVFPAVSDQSLVDVYDVNGGDLEATVDMLSQLESHADDTVDNLPEALDIGDVWRPVSLHVCSSAREEPVPGESSKSSDSANGTAST